jgi:hypothetical protein
MDHEGELAQFWARLRERLEAGARSYGEASFGREPAELAGEIEQELLDVCGWAFVLWCRLRHLRTVLRLEADPNSTQDCIRLSNATNSGPMS